MSQLILQTQITGFKYCLQVYHHIISSLRFFHKLFASTLFIDFSFLKYLIKLTPFVMYPFVLTFGYTFNNVFLEEKINSNLTIREELEESTCESAYACMCMYTFTKVKSLNSWCGSYFSINNTIIILYFFIILISLLSPLHPFAKYFCQILLYNYKQTTTELLSTILSLLSSNVSPNTVNTTTMSKTH